MPLDCSVSAARRKVSGVRRSRTFRVLTLPLSRRTELPRATNPAPRIAASMPSSFTLPVRMPEAASDPASESRRMAGRVSTTSATPGGSPRASCSMRSASARRAESARAATRRALCRPEATAISVVSVLPTQRRSVRSESTDRLNSILPFCAVVRPSVPRASARAPLSIASRVSTRSNPFATAPRATTRSTENVS